MAGVVYSAGKVFDGLSAGRRETEAFLRDGSTAGIVSRADLALLEDLRDAAERVIAGTSDPDVSQADLACQINAALSRSGSIHPGQLRPRDSRIGVSTPYGRHEPPALTHDELASLLDNAVANADDAAAIDLFTDIAKAQPFWDGNKRTALLTANAWLLRHDATHLLTVPMDDENPAVAAEFNDKLARYYLLGDDAVKQLLASRGFAKLGRTQTEAQATAHRAVA